MSGPFDPDDMPDEVLWELSDPNLDYDSIEECAFNHKTQGVYENVWGQKYDYDRNGEKLQSITTRYHEELKNYQQLLAEISQEKLPSKNKQVWWLYAESRRKKRQPTSDSGKWLIFAPPDQIDAAWEQIKDATEKGQLGKKSKVSTLKGYKGKDHVICVYTYNWKDEKDVMKIRNTLRELGFEKPLSYKSDADTLAGKYEHTGHKNIAKYYE